MNMENRQKHKSMRMITVFAKLFLLAIVVSTFHDTAAQDYGNALKRKQQGIPEEGEGQPKRPLSPEEKEYDTNIQIYLTTPQVKYFPGEQPEVHVYVKNTDKKTFFFKNIWSGNGAEGVYFRAYFDGRETWGSGIFQRKSVNMESPNPKDAVRLDPGEKKHILTIKFSALSEGEHTLWMDYEANYKVVEQQQRNWWNGLSKSNQIALKAKRIIPEKEITGSASGVIKKIHADIKGIAAENRSIAGYGDRALTTPKNAYFKIPVMDFQASSPERRRINIFFEKPKYEPSTLLTYTEDFPYLGIKLFAHIDAGKDNALRNKIMEAIKKRNRALYETTKKLASNIEVEVTPFSPEISKKLRRAAYIVRGTVKSREVEEAKPGDYSIRKWVIKASVKKVYKGKVKEKELLIKSGALSTFFGTENIKGKDYIFLLGEKNNWQKEYTLIGVEAPLDNIIDWLKEKYPAGK